MDSSKEKSTSHSVLASCFTGFAGVALTLAVTNCTGKASTDDTSGGHTAAYWEQKAEEYKTEGEDLRTQVVSLTDDLKTAQDSLQEKTDDYDRLEAAYERETGKEYGSSAEGSGTKESTSVRLSALNPTSRSGNNPYWVSSAVTDIHDDSFASHLCFSVGVGYPDASSTYATGGEYASMRGTFFVPTDKATDGAVCKIEILDESGTVHWSYDSFDVTSDKQEFEIDMSSCDLVTIKATFVAKSDQGSSPRISVGLADACFVEA